MIGVSLLVKCVWVGVGVGGQAVGRAFFFFFFVAWMTCVDALYLTSLNHVIII